MAQWEAAAKGGCCSCCGGKTEEPTHSVKAKDVETGEATAEAIAIENPLTEQPDEKADAEAVVRVV